MGVVRIIVVVLFQYRDDISPARGSMWQPDCGTIGVIRFIEYICCRETVRTSACGATYVEIPV